MSALTLILKALSFNDDAANSNPTQKPIDWSRTLSSIPVENAGTLPVPVEPGATVTVFNGSRTTLIDNTTQFSLALSPSDGNRYRITWTGGTAPGFRTDRNVATSGTALTFTVNANQTTTVTAASGTPFSSVQVGDTVFIPGVSTGDAASPFNALNEGYWNVLSVSGATVTLSRLAGEVFAGFAQVVTPSANSYFQAFSSTGVQVGDTVEISNGFSASAQHAYDLVAVNPAWIEFQSTAPLGAQTGISPTAAGLVIYTAAKRYVYVETDQEVVLRMNGDAGNSCRLEPIIPGDKKFVGVFMKLGHVWRLDVVSRSSARANCVVLSAE
jgi:hypothetical protein